MSDKYDVKWNGVTIDNPQGIVKLSDKDDGFTQVCCDCGLGHFIRTEGKTFEFQRVEFEDLEGIPADRKFKLREELKAKDARIAELEDIRLEIIRVLESQKEILLEENVFPSRSIYIKNQEALEKLKR